MATAVDNLKTARDNLASLIESKTADWLSNGCPPTYSIDGESYQWNEWLKARTDELDAINTLINKLSSPWIVRSRGRS